MFFRIHIGQRMNPKMSARQMYTIGADRSQRFIPHIGPNLEDIDKFQCNIHLFVVCKVDVNSIILLEEFKASKDPCQFSSVCPAKTMMIDGEYFHENIDIDIFSGTDVTCVSHH